MSSDKITVQRAFNTQFIEFIEDISSIYPDNIELKSAVDSFDYFRKLNPSLIIKAWYKYVHVPYANVIEKGDLDFFFNKDYSSDITNLSNNDEILKIIEKLRGPIQGMSDTNKEHTKCYLKNLNKLSNVYNMLS